MNIDEILEKYCNEIEYVPEYGEPGYGSILNPDKAILLANWNNIPSEVYDTLEEEGYGLEWSDEWLVDHEKGRCYRSSPDSYHWKPSAIYFGEYCQLITIHDIEEDTDIIKEYIDFLVNNPKSVNIFDNLDLTKYNFEKINTEKFQNGFHKGMNDNPTAILNLLIREYPNKVFIFSNLRSSQFYCEFDIYGKNL